MLRNLLFALVITCCSLTAFAQPGKPTYDIQVKRNGTYVGTITVELFPTIAPNHVHNFDSLVSTQFFDSTAFHRVIPGFMIQGGDPNSRSGPRATWGYGDPSQPTVDAEFSVAKHIRGTLAAARDADTNSATSQFYICVAPASWLNGTYTVYGRVVSGMNIVDTVVSEPRDANDNPYLKMEMFVTAAGYNDTLARVPVHNAPANFSSSNSTSRVLSWQSLSDGIIYHLQVSTDSTFATTFLSTDVGQTTRLVSGLALGTTYYWRVNSNNGGDTSAYSQWWCFNTSPTGIDPVAEANSILVAPNPGNGAFVFYNLKAENTIEIFDIGGKSILSRQVVNSTETIDLTKCTPGVYFYVVRNEGEQVQQGKLVIE